MASNKTTKRKPKPPTPPDTISKSDRERLNVEIKMIIRDINAVILGVMEHGNSVIRLNQCAAFIVTYMAECDEYYSGRSKGVRLPNTLDNFERLLEKLVELHTSTVPAINDPLPDEDEGRDDPEFGEIDFIDILEKPE